MKDILPTQLPEGWQQVPLEGLLERMSNGITKRQTKDGQGLPVSRIETISNGVIDYSRVGYLSDLSATEIEKFKLKQGDILFSHINSDLHLGKTAVYALNGDTLLHGMNLLLIRLNNEKVQPLFLHWLFNYYRFAGLFISIAQHAVNQSSINQAKLNKLPIILPPLIEQKKIVAEIEKQFTRLDAGVAALKRVQANLKRYRAAVLKAACEGKLVPIEAELARAEGRPYEPADQLLARILTERRKKWNGKGKYKEPAALDIINLPELPEGWTWASLDQVCFKITDGEHLSPNTTSEGVFLLSAKDVREQGVQLDDPKYVSLIDAEQFRKRCNPERGDILIVSRGATIGRTCVVQIDDVFCLMGSVILLKPTQPLAGRFLTICLTEQRVKRILELLSGSTAQQAIYIRDIRSLTISISPLAEQKRIVAEVERRLSVVEELEVVVDANLQRATRLRQAILQKAFAGQMI